MTTWQNARILHIVLFLRPDDGWQRSTVARTCPREAFWLITGRRRPCAARRTRCSTVTRPRTAPAGCFSPYSRGRGRPRPATSSTPGFGRWLRVVRARGAGPVCLRAGPSNGSGQRSPDLNAIECSAVYIPQSRENGMTNVSSRCRILEPGSGLSLWNQSGPQDVPSGVHHDLVHVDWGQTSGPVELCAPH
jgi:hypothetical protein